MGKIIAIQNGVGSDANVVYNFSNPCFSLEAPSYIVCLKIYTYWCFRCIFQRDLNNVLEITFWFSKTQSLQYFHLI